MLQLEAVSSWNAFQLVETRFSLDLVIMGRYYFMLSYKKKEMNFLLYNVIISCI